MEAEAEKKALLDTLPFLVSVKSKARKGLRASAGCKYQLGDTNFFLIKSFYRTKGLWGWVRHTPTKNWVNSSSGKGRYFYQKFSFPEVLENVPEEMAEKLLFHIELFV